MKDYATTEWQRAVGALEIAEHAVRTDPDSAASRAYYAAFHALTALFALRGQSFSKHSAIRVALHRDLIKTGEWTAKLVAVRRGVKEVIRSGHALIADRRIEVAHLQRQVTPASLDIGLRDRQSVILMTVPPRRAVGSRLEAGRLRQPVILADVMAEVLFGSRDLREGLDRDGDQE